MRMRNALMITALFLLALLLPAQQHMKMTMDMSCGGVPDVRLTTDQSSLTQVDLDLDVSSGSLTVDWGDGNTSTVTGTGSTYSHNYSSTGTYTIRVYGQITLLTKYYVSAGEATIGGNISTFEKAVNLTYLNLYNTSIEGNLSSVSGLDSLTTLNLGNTSIEGNLSSVSGLDSLTYLNLSNCTSLEGDIADLIALVNLNYLYLYNSGVDTYTSTTLPDWEGTNIDLDDLGLDQTEVDNFLVDLDNATGAPGNGTLDLTGNAVPSATGLTAKTSLEGKGWTVDVAS